MKVNHLPLNERLKFACYHSSTAKRPLWRLDTATGGMVCSLCGKPAPTVVFRVCCECGNEFVLKRDDPKWKPLAFVAASGKVFQTDFYCPPCY